MARCEELVVRAPESPIPARNARLCSSLLAVAQYFGTISAISAIVSMNVWHEAPGGVPHQRPFTATLRPCEPQPALRRRSGPTPPPIPASFLSFLASVLESVATPPPPALAKPVSRAGRPRLHPAAQSPCRPPSILVLVGRQILAPPAAQRAPAGSAGVSAGSDGVSAGSDGVSAGSAGVSAGSDGARTEFQPARARTEFQPPPSTSAPAGAAPLPAGRLHRCTAEKRDDSLGPEPTKEPATSCLGVPVPSTQKPEIQGPTTRSKSRRAATVLPGKLSGSDSDADSDKRRCVKTRSLV